MSEGQGLINKDPLNQTGVDQDQAGSKAPNLYPEVNKQDMTVNSFTKWTIKQLKAFYLDNSTVTRLSVCT